MKANLTQKCWVSAESVEIHSEERLLLHNFGAEYQAYRARTWRLLPGIY